MADRPSDSDMRMHLLSRDVNYQGSRPGQLARLYNFSQRNPDLQGTALRQAARGHAFTREHPTRPATAAERSPDVFRSLFQRQAQGRPPRTNRVQEFGNNVRGYENARRAREAQQALREFGYFGRTGTGRGHVSVVVRLQSGRVVQLGSKGGYRAALLSQKIAEAGSLRGGIAALIAEVYGDDGLVDYDDEGEPYEDGIADVSFYQA
jgi:hypothetical protein